MAEYKFKIEKKTKTRITNSQGVPQLKLKCKVESDNFKELGNGRIREFTLLYYAQTKDIYKDEVYTIIGNAEDINKHVQSGMGGATIRFNHRDMRLTSNEDVEYVALYNFLNKEVHGIGKKKITELLHTSYENEIIDFIAENSSTPEYIQDALSEEMDKPLPLGIIEAITDVLFKYNVFERTKLFLVKNDMPEGYRGAIYKQYGEKSLRYLHTKPFAFVNIFDIDEMNLFLENCPFKEEDMISSLIEATIFDFEINLGYTMIEEDELLEKVIQKAETIDKMSGYSKRKIKTEFKKSIKNNNVISVINGERFIQRSKMNHIQSKVERTLELMNENDTVIPVSEHLISDFINNNQRHAIESVLQSPVSILTGLAGTGKTTTLKEIVKQIIADDEYEIVLSAPTGAASNRMAEAINDPASGINLGTTTTHSYIAKNGFNLFKFEHNQTEHDIDEDMEIPNPKFFIVDEASMLDIRILYQFLELVDVVQDKVLFVGDVNQLPSIGPGQILKDMIDSELFNVSHLTQKMRQAEGNNGLNTLIDNIEQGRVVIPSDDESFEFHEIGTLSEKEILDIYIKEDNNLNYLQNIQGLIPMKVGLRGTNLFNDEIGIRYNRTKKHGDLIYKQYQFYLGDKVICIKNDSEKEITNGMIGTIVDLTEEDIVHRVKKAIRVQFGGMEVDFVGSEIEYLDKGYFITIHKSQGKEYSTSVIIIDKSHARMLEKRLVYTALTRAKERIVLISNKETLEESMLVEKKRTTNMFVPRTIL